jgi:myo-inositol 2-dehydrogenase/D-chiro-inositol 1-dehydrogenase
VASPTRGRAAQFAQSHGIPAAYNGLEEMLAGADVEAVAIGIPNDKHCWACETIARAGKHVICEKPLCVTLAEADRMIDACAKAGVLLCYAEELCFAPKYVRAKALVDEGALGRPFLVKQAEEHDGPHKPWFWDVSRSGGGAMLDMGCHGLEFARWIFGKPKAKRVWASLGTYVHANKTKGEDHSLLVVEFADKDGLPQTALIENSWAKLGGIDDRAEIYGSAGNTSADLMKGSALRTYSQAGYGYAAEKDGGTVGWTNTNFEEIWNYGFPQELAHFARAIRGKEALLESGHDGREVLSILWAGYASAGRGERIELPFRPPPKAKRPIEMWKRIQICHRDHRAHRDNAKG